MKRNIQLYSRSVEKRCTPKITGFILRNTCRTDQTYLAGELIHEKVAGLAGARVSWFSTDSVDAVLITLVQVGVAALVDFDFTTIASVSGAITDAIEAAAIRKFFARSIMLARK